MNNRDRACLIVYKQLQDIIVDYPFHARNADIRESSAQRLSLRKCLSKLFAFIRLTGLARIRAARSEQRDQHTCDKQNVSSS
ncbi:hypothetical protein D3C78_809560 [compost metagenome]